MCKKMFSSQNVPLYSSEFVAAKNIVWLKSFAPAEIILETCTDFGLLVWFIHSMTKLALEVQPFESFVIISLCI